jgi:NTP pyrophosphatase (non-canonical NTP hydrolase)
MIEPVYVELPPELVGTSNPDHEWIERELDRINPDRMEMDDGNDWEAMSKLVLEQRDRLQSIAEAAKVLQAACHGAAMAAGWWINPKTGVDTRDNPMCFSQKLMLIVSEVSEAMEGDRKSLMDDKLPHRPMREVELADAVIRIFDLAGAYNMDLGGAITEKLAFNAQRPDHKLANRMADGGKAY